MTRVYLKLYLGVMLALLFGPVRAEVAPYLAQNEFCVVQKDGGQYRFMDHSTFVSQWPKIAAKETRRNYEWFFVDPEGNVDSNILARVYPEVVDALLDSPSNLYKFKRGACLGTPQNKQLAQRSTYMYRSEDPICAMVLEDGELQFVNRLKGFPQETWVLFFYEGLGLNKALVGIVPSVLAQALYNSPDDFKQSVSVCPRHTGTEGYVKKNMPFILAQYGND